MRKRGISMKRTLMVLALFALVAFAGDFATGGADLTKFKGYGTFRWTSFGSEGNPQGSEFKDYVWMAWAPRINDHVDLCIAMQNVTIKDYITQLDQLFLNMKINDNFSVRGGQFKVPFGYGMTRSGGSMYFADRTVIIGGGDFNNFGGKDIGAMLTAKFAPVTVDLMLSNGTGNNHRADTTVNNQFTARLTAKPVDWLTVGGSLAMIGNPEIVIVGDSLETTIDAYSTNGIDFFAAANYPVSPTAKLCFEGEYMILTDKREIAEGWEANGGARMSVMVGYDMELDGDTFVRLMPAIRYDSIDPVAPIVEDADAPENNKTYIDVCVNIGIFSKLNTLQIGSRTYGFENEDIDGFTNIYTKWRMNF